MIDDLERYYSWYNRLDVKFEIVKQLYKREFALLVPKYDNENKKANVRMLKCHNVNGYEAIIGGLHLFNKEFKYNFYQSLAFYKDGIPHQSLNLSMRDNTAWLKNHDQHMEGYDFLIDIDAGDHIDTNWAYESTMRIKEELDFYRTPYRLHFSGKGFHIIIPYQYFPKVSLLSKDDKNIYVYYSKIAQYFWEKYSELIDRSIYHPRRLCKLPYSIASYDSDDYICWAFRDNEEFLNFKLSNYRLNNFRKNIRNRGLFVFNSGSTNKDLLKEVRKWHE